MNNSRKRNDLRQIWTCWPHVDNTWTTHEPWACSALPVPALSSISTVAHYSRGSDSSISSVFYKMHIILSNWLIVVKPRFVVGQLIACSFRISNCFRYLISPIRLISLIGLPAILRKTAAQKRTTALRNLGTIAQSHLLAQNGISCAKQETGRTRRLAGQ